MTTADANQFSRDAWEANAEVWDARMGDEGNDFFKTKYEPNRLCYCWWDKQAQKRKPAQDQNHLKQRGQPQPSGSIMKSGHGRSMSGRSSRDRRAARSPCPLLIEPEQLPGP